MADSVAHPIIILETEEPDVFDYLTVFSEYLGLLFKLLICFTNSKLFGIFP